MSTGVGAARSGAAFSWANEALEARAATLARSHFIATTRGAESFICFSFGGASTVIRRWRPRAGEIIAGGQPEQQRQPQQGGDGHDPHQRPAVTDVHEV